MAGQSRVDTTGSSTSSAASVVTRFTLSGLDQGVTYTTPPVIVGDLKLLCFWLRKTASATGNGLTVIPQFAVASIGVPGAGGTVVEFEWLDLSAATAAVFNQPLLLNFTFPAKAVRMQIIMAAGVGVGTETVELAYGGSQ